MAPLAVALALATAMTAAPAAGATAPASGAALSLADAEAIALARQPAIALARGQTESAEGRVEEARAGYLPQVVATGSYQRTTANIVPRPSNTPTNTLIGNPTGSWSSNTFNSFTFGASASQLIYDFGQTGERWRAAGVSRDAAFANERTSRAQALLNVRRAYFQAQAQKDLVTVAEEAVGNQVKHLEQTDGFVRAGIRPEIDLARARTDLANAKVQLVNARNADALAVATLNQAMGVPAGTRYQLTDTGFPVVAGEEGATEPLVDAAARARPEIANLELQRRAEEATIRSIRGAYGPALGAAAGVTDGGEYLDHLVPNWFAGLTLNWPIFQGGLTRGQVREAAGILASLNAQEDVLRLQIRVDVEQALLAVAAAKSNITASAEALTNARELLRLAERRYETGIGSAIELGDAQLAASTAAAQDVGARFNLSLARAQLLTAVGEP